MVDLVQRLRQGFQAGQEMQAGRLAQALGGQAAQPGFDPTQSLDFQRLAALDPSGASSILANFQALGQERQKAFFQDARKGADLLESGDDEGFLNLANNRIQLINQLGGNPHDVQSVLQTYVSGDRAGAIAQLRQADRLGVESGFLKDRNKAKADTAAVRSFEKLVEAANLTPTQRALAAKIELGIAPRAVGSAAQTISQDQQLTQDVATSQSVIHGATEGAKLRQQFRLKPKIAEAVALAQGRANLVGEQNQEARSNEKALNVYEVAFTSLADALGGTITGPGVGLMPAITSNAQMAEGAVAMVLPTLKSVFRESGEGTFTEGDQKLLTDMVPTRNDSKETIKFKLEAIDSIIRTKLGSATAPVAPAAPVAPTNQFEGFRVIR